MKNLPESSSRSPERPKSDGLQGRSHAFGAQLALLAGALVSVFLAGAPNQGGIGIFLVLAGLVLVFFSPPRAVPWIFWLLGALLILAVGSSMLPLDWMPAPSWRSYLQETPLLHLSNHVSLDPRATVFWLGMLFFSLCIGLYSLASPLAPRRMEQAALFVVLGCVLYAVVAGIAWRTNWHYPFFIKESWAQPAFGFFPNRNQTGSFLLTGAIVSLGLIYRGMHRGRVLPAILAACSFTLLLALLLFFSVSRGGVLFLIVGVVIWMAGLGRYRPKSLPIGIAAIFLLVLGLWLGSGGGLWERLTGHSPDASESLHQGQRGDSVAGNPADARVSIWRDTFPMIADSLITGSGLGTYALVYPYYADKSLRDKTTALHAESDWLTFFEEGGAPSLLAMLALLLVVMRRVPKLAALAGPEWPVRWAFLSAFFAEVLHGLVDVPFHKPELGWWLLLLGGIGLAQGARAEEIRVASRRLQSLLLTFGGGGMIVTGALMMEAQWGGGWAGMPPFAPEALIRHVEEVYGDGSNASMADAIAEGTKARALFPAHHPLYYLLGELYLRSNGNIELVKALFAAERDLSPRDPMVVLYQGKLIAGRDPQATADIWKEALRRQLVLDHLPSRPIPRTADLYREMLSTAANHPDLLARMAELSLLDRELRMIWLNQPSCDPTLIADAAGDDRLMEGLSAREKGGLFQLWFQRGDKNELAAFLETHPQYNHLAADTKANILSASGQEESACRFLIEEFKIPSSELSEVKVTTTQSVESDVPSDSLAAARYYMERGNDTASRRLLIEIQGRGGKNAMEAYRLQAMMAMRSGNWQEALAELQGYVKTMSLQSGD